MKKYLVLVMALLLILVPFSTRADDDDVVIFYDEEYEDEYDDYDDEDYDVEYYVEDYYDEDDSSDFDTVIMEADDTIPLVYREDESQGVKWATIDESLDEDITVPFMHSVQKRIVEKLIREGFINKY